MASTHLSPFRHWIAALLVASTAFGQAPETSQPSYLEQAKEVTEHMQKTFWQPETGLYVKATNDPSPEDMWGNGVVFSTLVAAARHDREKYEPVMKKFFTAMDAYWDFKVKIPGYEPLPTPGNGKDKYYDDNAWMVLTFLEAYELTGDRAYLTRADEALKFVLSGWDDEGGGGIWWHEGHKDGSKNTCSNAPSAVACLRLAKFVEPERAAQLVAKAQDIVTWTVATFQDGDGLFWDSKNLATGRMNHGKLTYNTALMIRAYLGLYRFNQKPEALAEAERIGAASDFFIGRRWPAYRNHVKWGHLLVEADFELHRAKPNDPVFRRAKQNVDAMYSWWKRNPPRDVISAGSIARELWLMADTETEVGREFWKKADQVPKLN